MEIARTGKTSSSPGWLNTMAELNARPGNAGGISGDGSAVAIGVGEANPAILGGPAAVRLIASGQTAEKTGVLAQVLRSTFSLGDSQLADVLPNASWDRRLDGLLKRA